MSLDMRGEVPLVHIVDTEKKPTICSHRVNNVEKLPFSCWNDICSFCYPDCREGWVWSSAEGIRESVQPHHLQTIPRRYAWRDARRNARRNARSSHAHTINPIRTILITFHVTGLKSVHTKFHQISIKFVGGVLSSRWSHCSQRQFPIPHWLDLKSAVNILVNC